MKRQLGLLYNTAIVGLAVIVIALTWAFVISQISYERREAAESAIRANTQRVMALEQYVARTLEQVDLATTYIADRYAASLQQSDRGPTTIRAINDTLLRSPTMREIHVFNRYGLLIATNVKPAPKSLSVYDTQIFQDHLSQPSTALQVNPPARSRFTSEWLLLLTRRVNLPDGSFGGTVSVQIRPTAMTDFLRDAELDQHDLISVISLAGMTLARREGAQLSFGQDLRDTLVMRMQEKNPNGSYLGPSSIDGKVRYFSHRRLPKYKLFVTSGVSAEGVNGPVQSRAKGYRTGGVIITVVTIMAAGLVFAIARRRTAHEAELLATNERLQEAQQLAKVGEWSYNVETGQLTWSDHLCAMYEHSGADRTISLEDYCSLVGQQGIQAFNSALDQSQGYDGRQEYELVARLPSGTVSHRLIVAVPNFDTYGQLVGMHGTDQDITPRKLVESLRQQVSQLSKLDALNAIAATLAHELNQPLTAASNYLNGSIRLISERADPQNNLIVEALTSVRDQIYHAGEIIRRVRGLMGDGHQQLHPISLTDVIGSAVSRFEAANPGSKVNFDQEPDVKNALVLADPIQIQQILSNLIRNAQESCVSQPQIGIKTRRGKDNRIDVCVIDNGLGITNDGRDIFSSLTTSKGDGLGLGLAICRTLIESMGGQISVEETGPHGTIICFSVRDASATTCETPAANPGQ